MNLKPGFFFPLFLIFSSLAGAFSRPVGLILPTDQNDKITKHPLYEELNPWVNNEVNPDRRWSPATQPRTLDAQYVKKPTTIPTLNSIYQSQHDIPDTDLSNIRKKRYSFRAYAKRLWKKVRRKTTTAIAVTKSPIRKKTPRRNSKLKSEIDDYGRRIYSPAKIGNRKDILLTMLNEDTERKKNLAGSRSGTKNNNNDAGASDHYGRHHYENVFTELNQKGGDFVDTKSSKETGNNQMSSTATLSTMSPVTSLPGYEKIVRPESNPTQTSTAVLIRDKSSAVADGSENIGPRKQHTSAQPSIASFLEDKSSVSTMGYEKTGRTESTPTQSSTTVLFRDKSSVLTNGSENIEPRKQPTSVQPSTATLLGGNSSASTIGYEKIGQTTSTATHLSIPIAPVTATQHHVNLNNDYRRKGQKSAKIANVLRENHLSRKPSHWLRWLQQRLKELNGGEECEPTNPQKINRFIYFTNKGRGIQLIPASTFIKGYRLEYLQLLNGIENNIMAIEFHFNGIYRLKAIYFGHRQSHHAGIIKKAKIQLKHWKNSRWKTLVNRDGSEKVFQLVDGVLSFAKPHPVNSLRVYPHEWDRNPVIRDLQFIICE